MTPEQIAAERQNRLRNAFVNNDFGEAADRLEQAGGLIENRDAFLKSSAIAGWAGAQMGRRINHASPEWQGIKDGIARGYFKNREASNVSDEELFQLISNDYKALEETEKAARIAASRGESWLGKFREAEKKVQFPTGRQERYLGLTKVAHDEFSKKIAPYRDVIETVKGMVQDINQPEGFPWEQMARELVKVPKADRPYVLESLSLQAAQPGEETTATQRLAMEFDRGLERFLTSAATAIQTAPIGAEYSEVGLIAKTPEQSQAEQERLDLLDLRDDLRDIAQGNLAPLEPVRMLGMNISTAVSSLPMTLGALVPYAGPAALVGSFQRETANEIRRQNPSMDRQTIEAIATVSAPLQALAEVASDRLLFGRLPNLKRVFTSPAFTASGIAAQLAARGTIGTGTEFAEEVAQDLIPRGIQEIASSLSEDIPDVNWQEYFRNFDSAELVAGILPLAIVGAGVGQLSDFRAGRDMARSPEMLEAAMFSPESAQEIAKAANAGEWAKAEDLMRVEWKKVNAKASSMTEIAVEASKAVQAKAINALQKEKANVVEAETALNRAQAQGLIPRVFRDAQGWAVQDNMTGDVTRTKSREEAVGLAYAELDDLAREEAQAMAKVLDTYSAGGDVINLDLGRRFLLSETGISEEAMKEAAITEGQLNGLTREESEKTTWLVLGQNRLETVNQVRRAVSDLYQGASVMDAIEEPIEGKWRMALEKGVFTKEEGIKFVEMAADFMRAPELVTTAKSSDRGLTEAISDIVLVDVFGRRKDGRRGAAGAVTAGIKARLRQGGYTGKDGKPTESKFGQMLAAFRALFKQIFTRFRALAKARQEGRVGQDFEAFLDTLIGTDTQTRVEAEAIQEVGQMVEEVDNQPFSLSRATPADTSKIVQMPDGAQLVGPTSFSIRAYHGTPHKVDRFSTSKIGTGEGAQAYGWGLYFAQARDVAEQYQKQLGSTLFYDERQLADNSPEANAAELLWGNQGDVEESLYYADNYEKPNEVRKWIRKMDFAKIRRGGNLYTVELLPDADEFLDWDKPLSKQSEKVKAALDSAELDQEANRIYSTYFDNSSTGQGIYESLIIAYREDGEVSAKAAIRSSELLASLGIPGIRYLDGGSRGAGDGTRNYVIFDENLVKILEENGKPVEGTSFSLAPARTAQDAEYLAAVQAGDMEKAQRMVDEAASKSGLTLAWRAVGGDVGSQNASGGFYATSKKAVAEFFAGTTGRVERVALELGRTQEVREDTGPDAYDSLESFRVAESEFRDSDFDSISALDIPDGPENSDVFVVRKQSQIKSAAPVTYDDAGNVIPLSQRFQPESPDIRFSLARATSLVEVADTILASRMRKPEFKEGFYIAARRRLEQLGKTILGAKIAGQRTPQNIEAERIFRLRSRQRELIDQGMAGLTPETMMAYSQGIESLKDHPFIIAMNRQGKLMKRSTAQKLGKLRTDGKGNAGDYDGAPALPPGFYSKGAGIMPFEMAQALYDDGILSEPLADAFWNELSSVVTSVKTNNAEVKKATDTVREIERNALKQATEEANVWADGQMKLQPSDRDRQLGAIRTLNAILSAFSPAIRGEVVGGNMGFINLAELKTDAARAKEITRVLNKLENILEREAKKYYTDKIDRMLERAQLKGKPGEVKKSDFIVTVQDELNLIQVAVDLDTDEVQAGITAAEAELMTADTPEKADSAMARMHLLETFGALFDEKNTTSAEMEVASDYLEQLMKQGREARRMLDEERRNKVKSYVEAASKDVFNGEIGPDTTQEARMKAAKKSGRTLLKKFFQEGLSYDLVLRYLFGADSKTAQEFGDRFILNSNAFEDTQNERRKRLRDFSRDLYKTKLGARINQKLMALDTKQANTGVTYLKGREVVTHKMDLEQAAKVVADPKAFGFTAADAKAISAELDAINTRNADPTQRKVKRLVYEQTVKTGDRVEIPLSQMDALYLSMALRQPGILEQQERYGYDQKTVDELENFLTDEAKAWREWMQEEYDAEYDVANQVYMRLFNTRMPQIKFYAPLLKNHQGNQAALDPLNSGLVAQSANPGSIKSRKARTSSLRIESALDVFWSHFNQMDYWVHMAEYLRDVQSVMLNPTVRDAVVSKHGTEGMQTLNAWITLQLGRGVSKGALVVAGNRMIRNIKTAVSMKALALSLSTTLKTLPSMLYSLGEIHLSKWPAALASGMKHWSRLWNTNIIQRRLDIGGMPELRDLGNSALPMSWINQGIRYGSYPTMYADGVFTTYSAAMAYGVSFDDAKAQGASDEMAHKHAEERTAIIVSKTAQPENWTQKSLLENDASGAGTLFYLFTSDPRQKAALTFEVFNRLRKGEASLEEASRKFLAYWVLPGMMFQLANAVGRSLFKGDDDEWNVVDFATAALVGQAQGFLLIGSSVEMIVSAAVAAAAEAITGEEVKGKPFWNSPKNPLDQAAQEMVKAAQTLNEDDGKTGLEKAWQLGKAASMGMSWMTPAGAIPSTAERVFKDTSNLFYSEED